MPTGGPAPPQQSALLATAAPAMWKLAGTHGGSGRRAPWAGVPCLAAWPSSQAAPPTHAPRCTMRTSWLTCAGGSQTVPAAAPRPLRHEPSKTLRCPRALSRWCCPHAHAHTRTRTPPSKGLLVLHPCISIPRSAATCTRQDGAPCHNSSPLQYCGAACCPPVPAGAPGAPCSSCKPPLICWPAQP